MSYREAYKAELSSISRLRRIGRYQPRTDSASHATDSPRY